MTTRTRSYRPGGAEPNHTVIACPVCSRLAPPYGRGIMAVTDADGWRHARICTTCDGWGRVRTTTGSAAYAPAPF